MSETLRKLKKRHASPSLTISDDIRNAILNGTLKVGELLPPERKMAESYKVNYSMVRKATQILVDEGLLVKRRGKGILVKALKPSDSSSEIKKLGLLLNRIDWRQPHYTAIIDSLGKALSRRGIELSLASSDGESVPAVLKEGELEGVVLLGASLITQIERLDALDIPYVSIGTPEGGNARHVGADEFSAGFLAAETLIEQGHRKILYIGSVDASARRHASRVAGYERSLAHHGLEGDKHFLAVEPDAADVKTLIAEALDDLSPTALITSGRTYAALTNEVLINRGTGVPEELSVVSLGTIELNIPSAEFDFDAVGSRYSDMTEQAVRVLVSAILSGPDEKEICSSYLVKASYLSRGSIKEETRC